MKSPDEIKKGLDCCADGNIVCAGNCVFDDDIKLGYPDCVKLLMTNALALIQRLEADNAQQARCIENMTDKLNAANDEMAKLQAERDAAVADIRLAFTSYVGTCRTCKHGKNQVDCIEPLRCGNCENEKCKCQSCDSYDSNWQWRGVQKEESDA